MIEVHRLTHCFGSKVVLEDLSLTIQPGEIVVLQGASGSGKTTLLRLIAGLDFPSKGEILIDGQSASTPGWILSPHRRGIGIVFQRTALWPHMTVAGNMLFVMDGLPKAVKMARIKHLLQRANLEDLEYRYPGKLSGGEARRVDLLRALAAWPARLLLDEPLTNLDAELKQQLLEVVLDYVHQQTASLLYVTHDMNEADLIGGRIVRLENRRIL